MPISLHKVVNSTCISYYLVFIRNIYKHVHVVHSEQNILCYEGVTGHSLVWIVWEAERRLEEITLKVRILVHDHCTNLVAHNMPINEQNNFLCSSQVGYYCHS